MSEPETFNVGGLRVTCYGRQSALASPLPVGILILTHGRSETQSAVRPIAETAIRISTSRQSRNEPAARNLIVCTLTQRNHDERVVDPKANQSFKGNEKHAVDMYAIQRGTARDVSFLVDFLEAYLFPRGEKVVEGWYVAGVSLGGHVTWHCLRDDPRFSIGIVIIGCPDFHSMIKDRMSRHPPPSHPDGTLIPPFFPPSLQSYISSTDPISAPYTSLSPFSPASSTGNPYLNKRILLLNGAEDRLVPPRFSQGMFDALVVGEEGAKECVVQEGAGHEVTEEMRERLGEWVWKWGLKADSGSREVKSNL